MIDFSNHPARKTFRQARQFELLIYRRPVDGKGYPFLAKFRRQRDAAMNSSGSSARTTDNYRPPGRQPDPDNILIRVIAYDFRIRLEEQ